MKQSFHMENRRVLYSALQPSSVLLVFSGNEVRKTNDEYYPFFADRNFVYLTGLECKEAVLLAVKDGHGDTQERLYILPSDPMAERWTGRRVSPAEAREKSGVEDVRASDRFEKDMHALLAGGHYSLSVGHYEHLYLDLYRADPADRDRPA